MEFNYFDIIVAIIILFLGLKGIINGFFKEVFGLIGIIGGIFLASRVGDEIGQILSDSIFKFENHAAISFTGFISTLLVFWLLMIGVGYAFKKLSSLSGLGAVDKLFGFLVGASKFFLIAAVIAHAAYNIKAVKGTIDPLLSNSVLFPILVETGSVIMKLDPVEISDDINITVTKQVDNAQKHIEKAVEKSVVQRVDEIKEDLKKSIPKAAKEI
jgi:membrane protein required for colicin V production